MAFLGLKSESLWGETSSVLGGGSLLYVQKPVFSVKHMPFNVLAVA